MAVRKLLVMISGLLQELPGADSISIALGWLQQGGATSGQVITWNGSAWAPATPSGGGGGISHATSDGTPYASRNGAWERIPYVYRGTTYPISAGSRLGGDTWLTDEGQMLVWFPDADSGQWVNPFGIAGITFVTADDIEITDSNKGVIMRSPDGSRWRMQVNDSGNWVGTKL